MHYPISSGVTVSVNKGLLYIDCDELHDIEEIKRPLSSQDKNLELVFSYLDELNNIS